MMKRTLCLLLTVVLLLGCQPTPTEEIVRNKTDGRLDTLIGEGLPVEEYTIDAAPWDSGKAKRTLRSVLGAPERLEDEVKGRVYGGTLDVVVDADVIVPDVDRVAVYSAELLKLTPAEAEAVAADVLGGAPYCNVNDSLIERHDLETTIQRYTDEIANASAPIDASDPSGIYAEMNQFVRALRNLQVDETMHPWEGSFADERLGVANADNTHFGNSKGSLTFDTIAVGEWERGWSGDGETSHAPKTESEREIAQTAEAFLRRLWHTETKALTIESKDDDYTNRHRPFTEPMETYRIELAPLYGGIPSFHFQYSNGSDTARQHFGASEDDTAYGYRYSQERIHATVQKGEVIHVEWTSPLRVLSTENENIELLAFPKIWEIFQKQVLLEYYIDPPERDEPMRTETIRIEQIRLSMMRVQRPDSDTFYILPVWDFVERMEWAGQDEVGYIDSFSLMTINAIDGSIINRNRGY